MKKNANDEENIVNIWMRRRDAAIEMEIEWKAIEGATKCNY